MTGRGPVARNEATAYGESMAPVYDGYLEAVAKGARRDVWGGTPDPDAEVSFLEDLAGGGPVLELGIGTGRVALPLARRGVEVHGIEISPAMVEVLRAKPGGDGIGITVGDFAEARPPGTFSLAYAVFSTLFMLGSRDEQVRAFANVAAHLEPGRAFVVEVFVPRFPEHGADGWVSWSHTEDADTVLVQWSRDDPAEQRLEVRRAMLGRERAETFTSSLRYAGPAELDDMAGQAGMRLRKRWSGWRRQPFTPDSMWNVSVYECPA